MEWTTTITLDHGIIHDYHAGPPYAIFVDNVFARSYQARLTDRLIRIRSRSMGRPVTLFTGQWADLKIEEMARKTKEFGYDGIELACWGDHFEVDKALADDKYCARKRELLESLDLQCHAISAHLVGQAVLDTIDAIPHGLAEGGIAEGMGHLIMMEQPARLAEACIGFLRRRGIV